MQQHKWVKADQVWDLKSDAADAAGMHMAMKADEGEYPLHKLVRVKVQD
jgi:hypothetical protein